ncbi:MULTISPECIES: FAD-dependent monooxygenase [unclassified Streptomyces]|uniref:FAD-dependent monooxygenase n=1 Tax=unclassified Streptomyces TaxID=2593676 RepID=UPI0035DB42C7
MESRLRAQVVIVGGGPVGMLMAAELGGRGVRTVVLEARASVCDRPKARVLHARALQGLARRGYLTELVPRGISGTAEVGVPFRFGGVAGLTITASASEPGPVLKRPQADLERLFEQRARAVGVRVLREHRVTQVFQDLNGVRVLAEGPLGSVECTALYLVGADGGRGVVRELAGFAARTYEATASGLSGLVRLEDADDPGLGWHHTPRGWIVAHDIPGEGTHIRTLDCSDAHAGRGVPPTGAELRREVARIAGREVGFGEVRWLSRFSDFSRLAECFGRGRVFLAGDAAHLHFPVGAQGLSLGVQDALNLGWKLALAVRGCAGVGLLDTYDQERRPAAERVIEVTLAQLALMRARPEAEALRSVFAGVVAAGGGGSRYLSDLISGQDVVLPPVAGGGGVPERRFLPNVALRTAQGPSDVVALLRGGGWLLLLFGERGAAYGRRAGAWADVVRLVRAEPVDEVACDAVLVRPDGYVAWAVGAASRSGPRGACSAEGEGARLEGVLVRYLGRGPGGPFGSTGQSAAGGVGAGV